MAAYESKSWKATCLAATKLRERGTDNIGAPTNVDDLQVFYPVVTRTMPDHSDARNGWEFFVKSTSTYGHELYAKRDGETYVWSWDSWGWQLVTDPEERTYKVVRHFDDGSRSVVRSGCSKDVAALLCEPDGDYRIDPVRGAWYDKCYAE